MKLFANEFHLMKVTDVKRMASSSNDKFCSLDMLAEVASATLQNDPSLSLDFPFLKAKNKVGNASPRKSVSSYEKLSLDQIKALSEKNLIEMFSELICDEMKKNYSFQCFLIPDKCSQVFKSFGNETRARCKMKIHLQSHINDLVAIANVTNDSEVFMAEPLHVRRKRLREMTQKNTRKKKRIKQPPMKLKKDTNLELFSKDIEDANLFTSEDYEFNNIMCNKLNLSSEVNCNLNSAMTVSVSDKTNDHSENRASKKFKSSLYFSSHNSICDPSDEQVIFKDQQTDYELENSTQNSVIKKYRSRHLSDTKRTSDSSEIDNSTPTSSSDHNDDNFQSNCASPVSDFNLPVLHDHTYTFDYGRIINCDRPSTIENSRSTNKMFRDSFQMKKSTHRCKQKEPPLIIPTPPYPFIYIPLLPHIALIQEVGRKFKTSTSICTCLSDIGVSENPYEYSYLTHVPLLLERRNTWSKDTVNESISNINLFDQDPYVNLPSETYTEEVIFENINNTETIVTKFSDSPFYVDDLMRNENPETLKADEKE